MYDVYYLISSDSSDGFLYRGIKMTDRKFIIQMPQSMINLNYHRLINHSCTIINR